MLKNKQKIAQILLTLDCNFSGLGWWILDFSKPVGQVGFGAYSEAKLVLQFIPTKFLCHKMFQNCTVFSVSHSRDCTKTIHVHRYSGDQRLALNT